MKRDFKNTPLLRLTKNPLLFWGVIVEGSLIPVSILIDRFVFSNQSTLHLSAKPAIALFGGLMCLPLVGLGRLFVSEPIRKRFLFSENLFQKLKSVSGEAIVELHWSQALLLSVLAGVGEEFFFRGILSFHTHFLVSALIFALLHALSFAYAVIAFGAALYFEWLKNLEGSLSVPIIVHVLYDFYALLFLKTVFQKSQLSNPVEIDEAPNWIWVETFSSIGEAQIAAAKLRSESIDVLIENESMATIHPGVVDPGGGFKVLVPSEQLENAKQCLQIV